MDTHFGIPAVMSRIGKFETVIDILSILRYHDFHGQVPSLLTSSSAGKPILSPLRGAHGIGCRRFAYRHLAATRANKPAANFSGTALLSFKPPWPVSAWHHAYETVSNRQSPGQGRDG